MWCGQPPELALFSPCCLIVAVAVTWAIAALGGTVLTQPHGLERNLDCVCIAVIAIAAMALGQILSAPSALLLAAILAAHSVVIAISLVFGAPRANVLVLPLR